MALAHALAAGDRASRSRDAPDLDLPGTVPTHVPACAEHWIGIEAAAYVLPGDPIDVRDWARTNPADPERLEAIIDSGSRCFHAAAAGTEVDLAAAAVERLIAQGVLAPAEVDAIVHVHTMAMCIPAMPRSLPLELATRFGMSPAWCGSISQLSCVSLAAGLRTVDALLRSDARSGTALIVSADRLYDERSRLRQSSGIQSDGAGCLLVRRNSRANRVGAVAIHSHARWYGSADRLDHIANEMISLEWKFTRDVVDAACSASGQPASAFAQFLPQNFKQRGFERLCQAIGLPAGRLFDRNVAPYGHACCSDLAINLADAGLATLRGGGAVLVGLHSNVGAYAALTLHPVEPIGRDAPTSCEPR